MRVHIVPILFDNYAYVLVDEASGEAAVVDPAEPEPVLRTLAELGVKLTTVLCTHHHADHSGGNVALAQAFAGVRVVGSEVDGARIPALSHPVKHEDTLCVGTSVVRVLYVPCHTRGHVAYFCDGDLFCGDTLFVAGCGRFFEGTAADMDRALNEVLGGLAPETRIYCGHEYTLDNLAFAQTVEPENKALQEKLAWARDRRAKQLPTVPSTLGEERTYNPFLRVREETVAAAMQERAPEKVMAKLREAKNRFKAPATT
jgi:hydroxyacylglutathione hydrolase